MPRRKIKERCEVCGKEFGKVNKDYEIITDVGQNQNPKTFLRNMKEKYGEKLIINNNPYEVKNDSN